MAETLMRFEPYKAKKGEEYMNAKQLQHFRKMLEAWKAELSQDIDTTLHSMQDEQTVFADPNDRATQESDMALELRNRDRERKLIKKITETIAKIDSGDLLSQGQRVLVTAHTSKALRVLRDKVVDSLQTLCVSVLDSETESKKQL